jgi:hypothetical protein
MAKPVTITAQKAVNSNDFHNHTSEVRGKRNARYREKCFQKNKFGTDPYRTGSAEAGSAEHRASDTAVV